MFPTRTLTGRYEYGLRTNSWWWSEEIYRIYGLEHSAIRPSTEAFVEGLHSDDRATMRERFDACCQKDGSWGGLWRLHRNDATERFAAYSGAGIVDAHGVVTGVSGYVVDVTEMHGRVVRDEANEQVDKALSSREAIDQAKGALMLLYGMDADDAFGTLKWCSQRSNQKLSAIADRIVKAVRIGLDVGPEVRARIDETLYSLTTGGIGTSIGSRSTGFRSQLDGVESGANTRILTVFGAIDLATVAQFTADISRLMSDLTAGMCLVVDLRGVDTFGSVGVPVLTSAQRRCLAAGAEMRLVMDDGAHFGATRHEGLPVFASLEEATT